jgi:hypothetical protein
MTEYYLFHLDNRRYMFQSADDVFDFMVGSIENFTEDLESEYGTLMDYVIDRFEPRVSYFTNPTSTIKIVNMF